MRILFNTNSIPCYRLNKITVYFLIYSFIGWFMEVTYVSFISGHLVNRGFLIGPFCCIYGFGALLIIVFLKRFKHNAFLLFSSAAVITSVLEYITGYFLEKTFNNKWWDYSDQPFNIAGRICLRNALIWGVIAVIATYFVHPLVKFMVKKSLRSVNANLAYLIIIYFISDFIMSSVMAAKAGIYTGQFHHFLQGVNSFIQYMQDVSLKNIESIKSVII